MLTHDTFGDPPVHFYAGGAGRTLLFLHGFNGGAGLWTPNMDDLVDRGFRCIAPDLPGWGETAPPPHFTYRVPDLVRWLCTFLDQHGPGPITVVGHSFGGAVALYLALHHPERVSRLVLVNSAGLTPRTIPHYRLLAFPFLGEWLLKPSAAKVQSELAAFAVGDLQRIPPEVMAYIHRIVQQPWFTRTSLHWVRRNGVLFRGARAISQRHRLGQITQPTLILAGGRDPIIDHRDSVDAASLIPGAVLRLFPEGLHLLPLDYRDEFADLVAGFTLAGEAALQRSPDPAPPALQPQER